MLDGGAQACTITNDCAIRLGHKQKPFETPLMTINNTSINVKFRTSATIRSRFNKQKHDVEFLIVEKISNSMPSYQVERNNLSIPKHLFLADPKFHEPAPIDILLGAEYTAHFI